MGCTKNDVKSGFVCSVVGTLESACQIYHGEEE